MRKMKPILLTFSEKNRDVYELINNRDKKEFKQITDYICNSIRFYEKFKKDAIDEDAITEEKLENIVLKVLKKHNIDSTGTAIDVEKDDIQNLEDALDSMDIDIDED